MKYCIDPSGDTRLSISHWENTLIDADKKTIAKITVLVSVFIFIKLKHLRLNTSVAQDPENKKCNALTLNKIQQLTE